MKLTKIKNNFNTEILTNIKITVTKPTKRKRNKKEK